MKIKTLPILSLSLFLFLQATNIHARTWTNQSGKTLEGELQQVQDDIVTIKRNGDGRIFRVPVSTLSSGDQQYILAVQGASSGEESGFAAPATAADGSQAATAPAPAQPRFTESGYPLHYNDYVNDFAKVIKPVESERIRKLLEDLERQTGIEMVAVTVNSINDYKTGDTSIESFATNLFNAWGVGHKKANNGVMLLAAVKDRNCRIELGGGYHKLVDLKMKAVIDNEMLPYFKDGDYGRGLFEGARGVIGAVTEEIPAWQVWGIRIGIFLLICFLVGVAISCFKSGRKGWGFACLAAIAAILFFLIRFSDKRSRGFGGGSSSGGGASGSW